MQKWGIFTDRNDRKGFKHNDLGELPFKSLNVLPTLNTAMQTKPKRSDIFRQAFWIHSIGLRNPKNHFAWFRKQFHLPQAVASAKVSITADSRYQLFVNGRFIGRGPARCDPRFQAYDTYDITQNLHGGLNVICVLVHHYGVGTGAYILGMQGLLLEAVVRLKTGRAIRIQTDESWRSQNAHHCWQSDVQRINAHQGFREVYDARNEPQGLLLPNDDAASAALWAPVRVLGRPPLYPWLTLQARDIPMAKIEQMRPKRLLEMGLLKISHNQMDTHERQNELEEIMWQARHVPVKCAVDLQAGRPAYFIYDMGREISAYYQLNVDAPAGTIIDIGSSERLENNQMVLPAGVTQGALPRTVDRYITRAGRQAWSNAFNWRGLRYLQVVVHPWSAKIRSLRVSALRTTADVPRNGRFACSDKLLNRLWQMGLNTAEACMQDGIMENAWREQQQYIGDGRLANLFVYYTFGDQRLPRNLIRQVAQSQGPLGEVQSGYPWSFDQVITEYCTLWITALKEYLLFTGDRGFVGEMAQTLKGILGWLARYRNSAGLLENVPGWTFLDWTNPAMTGRGRNIKGLSAGLNLFYLQGLMDAAWLAKHALPELQAAKLEQQAVRLRKALHETFWNSACGCYVDSAENGRQSASVSQHINALALLLDVAAPEQRRGILARVWESNTPAHQPSPYFCFYVFRALAKCGRYDLAVKALREKWLPMVMAGNETFWETFQSATKQKGFPESYCQLWSCAPLYDLPAEVLGVKPLQPAFRLFEVCPTPADLQWARGQVPTPHGLIKVAWQRNGKALQIDLQVPDRCAAVTRNPEGWVEAKTPGSQKHQASPHIFHAGSHRISYRLE